KELPKLKKDRRHRRHRASSPSSVPWKREWLLSVIGSPTERGFPIKLEKVAAIAVIAGSGDRSLEEKRLVKDLVVRSWRGSDDGDDGDDARSRRFLLRPHRLPLLFGENISQSAELAGALEPFTAIHDNLVAVDVARLVAHQERRQVSQFLVRSKAA